MIKNNFKNPFFEIDIQDMEERRRIELFGPRNKEDKFGHIAMIEEKCPDVAIAVNEKKLQIFLKGNPTLPVEDIRQEGQDVKKLLLHIVKQHGPNQAVDGDRLMALLGRFQAYSDLPKNRGKTPLRPTEPRERPSRNMMFVFHTSQAASQDEPSEVDFWEIRRRPPVLGMGA